MILVKLQPYRIRENKLIPVSEEILELDWNGYKKLLAPSNTKESYLVLRKVKIGSFVGLIKRTNKPAMNFGYHLNGYNSLAPLLKSIPNLIGNLESLYKVISIDFGTRIKYR